MSRRRLEHELIRASAGAGKTYELTNRYLRLLRLGQPEDQILAATFTRKAAGEILGRVLLRLAEAATDDQKLAELQTALKDELLTREVCLRLLAETARRLHRLRIGTLDSFFAQLAGSFALEIGLPPGWRIAEEHEDASLRARALEAVFDNEDTASLLTLLHALTRGETTRSLDREVRDKLDGLYSVYRESHREAWHRLPRMRELTEAQLAEAIGTLQALPLPQHKTWKKTREQDAAHAESGDWSAFLRSGLASKVASGEDRYCGKPIEAAVAAAYRALLEQAQAVLTNQLANQTEATYQLLDRFHAQYQRLKTQSRLLRFEDITYQLADRPLALAPAHDASGPSPAGEPAGGDAAATPDGLAFRLDAPLRHLLLDEFQDTSLAQWSVLRPFALQITGRRAAGFRGGGPQPGRSSARRAEAAGRPAGNEVPPPAGPASLGSFFCVGDPKQAIYGWRGGVAEVFDAVTRELKGIRQRPLDTSWRSSPHVITAVNQIFGNLHRHGNLGELAEAVVGWQRQFHKHQTAEPKRGLNGYVCLQAARAAKTGEAEEQKEITLRFAAERAADWKQRAPGFTIGVLVRRNDAVRRLIYELRELGIEASEEGGSSLDDSAAVRLLLSLLRLADHPGDLVARFHVATSPLAQTLGLWASDACGTAAIPGGDARPPEVRFASSRGDADAGCLARRVRHQLVDEGYGRTVYGLARQLAPACNRRELRRLEKLIGLAYQYDDAATTRPRDFAAYVDAARVRDPVAADVRVMTVHQAKGLEFDIVVLADLEAALVGQRGDLVVGRPSPTEAIDRICRWCNKEAQRLLPESWQPLFRQSEDQDVAESLCVLYVAVTRARHALHMIVGPSAKNEKSLHKTFAGLLRAALTDGQPLAPGQIAWEIGDGQWFRNPGVDVQPSAAEASARAESLPPLEVRLATPQIRRWRGLQRVSPSGLEGGTRVRLSETRGEHGDRAAALAYGTLIHAWFEQIEWLDDVPPGEAQLREVAAALPDLALSGEYIDRLLAEFRHMLARPGISACLRRTAYRDWAGDALNVERERPFAVREGDQLLVGSIDRLVTVYRQGRAVAAEIMDFKTDALAADDPEALARKVEFYRPQLSAYRSAVCSMLQQDASRVRAKLLFVGPGIVAEV